MTFKIKLTDNFLPLTTFSASEAYFKLILVFLCIWLWRVCQTYTIPIKVTLVVLFSSLEHIFTKIKTKFKFSFFSAFSTGLCGGTWTLQTSCTGGFLWIDFRFLSSMTLYNHLSYFKSVEINSFELSPLPTCMFNHICLPKRVTYLEGNLSLDVFIVIINTTFWTLRVRAFLHQTFRFTMFAATLY